MADAMSAEGFARRLDKAAPMSDAALAEIKAHNGQYGLGDATDIIGELLAEVERLRAQLAEIGETREEWTIERRWRDGMVTQTKTWADEATARANLAYEPADDFHRDVQVSAKPHLMRRLAGEWREPAQ